MEELDALTEQHDELSKLLATLEDEDWQRPSRCEGWTVADVVLHLAQTNEMAIGSARGHFEATMRDLTQGLPPAADVDDGAAAMVARDRTAGVDAVRARFARSVDALQDALSSADPHRRVQWVAGELTVRTLITTRLAETWIHTGDVADGVGAVLPPAERLRHVARLAWRTLPYAFSRAGRTLRGPVVFDLRGPAGGEWRFVPDGPAATTVEGDGVELCLVAARRVAPGDTGLRATGPDGDAVLDLVRTYA